MAGLREIPDLMHRLLFRGLSLLRTRNQAAVLGRYFDWWHRTPDPWSLSTDEYERHKYLTTLGQVPERPFKRILDAGCSEGVFTRLLAETFPDAEITGVDVSERALARARERASHLGERVRFTRSDILAHGGGDRYDLIFCAETLYYLGREDRVRGACARLGGLLEPGGVLVAVHPWPESRRLHGHLDSSTVVRKLTEHVDDQAHRPFEVSVYQTAEAG